MKKFLLVMLLTVLVGPSWAAVVSKEVTYTSGDKQLKGLIAYDDSSTLKRPGILVVHEWWGYNAYARKRAMMLAELGYVAMAIDMYGEGRNAEHPKDAMSFMQEALANAVEFKARFMSGYEVLKKFEFTQPDQIGAIGYCFGGATVIKMLLSGVDLKGAVSFHGSLQAPEEIKSLKTSKLLVCHGEVDSFITPEQLTQFKNALDAAKVDYKLNVYPKAKHGFTNPDADAYAQSFSMDIGYNAAADEKSWADMRDFLKTIFGQ